MTWGVGHWKRTAQHGGTSKTPSAFPRPEHRPGAEAEGEAEAGTGTGTEMATGGGPEAGIELALAWIPTFD